MGFEKRDIVVNMKAFQFQELTDDEKKILLSAFDYTVDEEGNIIDNTLNEKVISKTSKNPINIKNVALLGGSLIITDSDPLTLSRYLRERIEDDSWRNSATY